MHERVCVCRTHWPHLQHAALGGALGFEVFLSALLYRAIFILFLFSTHYIPVPYKQFSDDITILITILLHVELRIQNCSTWD